LTAIRIPVAGARRVEERLDIGVYEVHLPAGNPDTEGVERDLLEQAFFELKDNAAPGVDGLTWTDYETEPRAQQKALRIGKVRSRSR
jgi:hypothetical protein